MRIFLTGGTGYLGGGILRELLDHGHEVVAQIRRDRSAAALESIGARTAVGDLTDGDWLRDQLDEVDGMINAASPNDATSVVLDVAVLDTALPVLAERERPYVHTAGTWDLGSGSPITENTPPTPPAMVMWRPAIVARVRAAAHTGVRSCVVAPANLYGRGAGLPAMIIRGPITAGEEPALLFPGGQQNFAHVHVRDVARLFRLALEHAPAGEYFLGSNGAATTMAELAAAGSQLRGLGGRIEAESDAATRARLGPLTDPLLLDAHVDPTHAHRVLGWQATAIGLLEDVRHGSYAKPLQ